MNDLGYSSVKSWRKGGIEHGYWIEQVAEWLRNKGYVVEVEKPIGEGKAIDLVGKNDNATIALGIETGKSNAIWNIRKDLQEEFDRVISIGLNRKIRERTQKQLKEAGRHGDKTVNIVEIKDFWHRAGI